MANKRNFKKYVDALSSSLYNEMMICYCNVDKINKEKVEEAITKILEGMAFARNNANMYFDKGVKAFANPKEYSKEKKQFFKKLFNKIAEDYSKNIDEALKLFNSAIPQEEKNKNKELS